MEQPSNPMQQAAAPQPEPQVQPMAATPDPKGKSKNLILIIILVILLAVSGGLGYLYYQERQKASDPLAAATEEAQALKEKVGVHILLPSDEDPAIATIIDISKLKEQNPDFYANAENGDKLLVYSNKAILYDPDGDIILNVAPIIRPQGDEGLETTTNDTETTDTETTE